MTVIQDYPFDIQYDRSEEFTVETSPNRSGSKSPLALNNKVTQQSTVSDLNIEQMKAKKIAIMTLTRTLTKNVIHEVLRL